MKEQGVQCTQFVSSRKVQAKYVAPCAVQRPPLFSKISPARGNRHNNTIQQQRHRTRKGSVQEQEIERLHKQQTSSEIGEVQSPKTYRQEAPKEKASLENPPPVISAFIGISTDLMNR